MRDDPVYSFDAAAMHTLAAALDDALAAVKTALGAYVVAAKANDTDYRARHKRPGGGQDGSPLFGRPYDVINSQMGRFPYLARLTGAGATVRPSVAAFHQEDEEATRGIEELPVTPLTKEQTEKVRNIIEPAATKALSEWQQQAVDVAHQFPEAERKIAHKVALTMNYEALIANLSSMR